MEGSDTSDGWMLLNESGLPMGVKNEASPGQVCDLRRPTAEEDAVSVTIGKTVKGSD